MYVFFENHKDSDGVVLATDVIMSSYEDSTRINFAKDKFAFEFVKKLLKVPDIGVRSYSDETKIWSYLGDAGAKLLIDLEATFKTIPTIRIEFRFIEGLEAAVRAGYIDKKKSKVIDPKDFFYNKPQPQELTKEVAAPRLAKLLECEISAIDKLLYRRAALKYHPDRNGGDGTMMSELNMLWRIYNA